jgi:hypothetical protein
MMLRDEYEQRWTELLAHKDSMPQSSADHEVQSDMNQEKMKGMSAMSEDDEVDYDDEREEPIMLAGGGDSVGSSGHITKLF